jgi:hypothetical protein
MTASTCGGARKYIVHVHVVVWTVLVECSGRASH